MTYPDSPELPQVFLGMGQVHISEEPVVISTVLGSCISVTMFNRQSAMGGCATVSCRIVEMLRIVTKTPWSVLDLWIAQFDA